MFYMDKEVGYNNRKFCYGGSLPCSGSKELAAIS
jgi:hypothetical protein